MTQRHSNNGFVRGHCGLSGKEDVIGLCNRHRGFTVNPASGSSLILLTLPGNRLPVRESHCPAFFISNVQGECVMTNRQTNPEKPKYFDLDINGIGYLNRAREVTPENGIPFLSVTIAALRGPADNVQHTHFDCVVSGEEASCQVGRVD